MLKIYSNCSNMVEIVKQKKVNRVYRSTAPVFPNLLAYLRV